MGLVFDWFVSRGVVELGVWFIWIATCLLGVVLLVAFGLMFDWFDY